MPDMCCEYLRQDCCKWRFPDVLQHPSGEDYLLDLVLHITPSGSHSSCGEILFPWKAQICGTDRDRECIVEVDSHCTSSPQSSSVLIA